jgi:adenylate cyclase
MPHTDGVHGPSTFLFADMAGYTALTEAHGDEQAADLAQAFGRTVAELVPAGAGEVVKTIGDAVMVRLDEPLDAVRLGLHIAQERMDEHGTPTVRVGMHRGEAIERDGDWFGSTVNVAARVTGLASGGEVLLTVAVRDAAGEVEQVSFERRGEQRLRHVASPIELFAAVRDRRGHHERHLDPVCQMVVVDGREAAVLKHEGVTYRFCSLACVERFARDPESYVAVSRKLSRQP